MIFSKLCKDRQLQCPVGTLERRPSSGPAVQSPGRPGSPGPVAELPPQDGWEPEGRPQRYFHPQPRLQRPAATGRPFPAEPSRAPPR